MKISLNILSEKGNTESVSGAVVYRGPSKLNGKPIVVVVTGIQKKSKNVKTGDILQTWIMSDEKRPTDALRDGEDSSVCGDCIHRKVDGIGSCYVNVALAPYQIYKYIDNYKRLTPREVNKLIKGRVVRLGAYGDPTAVPIKVWNSLLKGCKWVGYTHQWNKTKFKKFRKYCMASVESVKGLEAAKVAGWRTFRIRLSDSPLQAGEFECPASKEAGNKKTCAECRACNGGTTTRVSPSIILHGPSWKKGRLTAYLQELNKE